MKIGRNDPCHCGSGKKYKSCCMNDHVANTQPVDHCHVAKDEEGEVMVSTVFSHGICHRWGDEGDPVLWETMIFGGEHDQYQERYTSYEDALEGHKAAVKLALNKNK